MTDIDTSIYSPDPTYDQRFVEGEVVRHNTRPRVVRLAFWNPYGSGWYYYLLGSRDQVRELELDPL